MTDESRDAALEEALLRLERDTEGPLTAWADARQAEVEAALRETTAGDRRRSVQVIEKAAGHRLRRRFGPGLAAAALAAGLGLGYFGRGMLKPERVERTTLGTEAPPSIPVHPGPTVDHYDFFAWSGGVDQQRYGLRVWNEGELRPVLEIDDLRKSLYEPTREQLELLRQAIRWEVWRQTKDGQSSELLFSASSSLR